MKMLIPWIMLATLLLGLPLAGVWLEGCDASTYLEFPPRTQYIEHAPFSWSIFIGLALVILGVILPFLIRIIRTNRPRSRTSATTAATTRVAEVRDLGFPWWGWLALGLGIVFWSFAWTRFTWFSSFQLYTFSPLWVCYIVAVNAFTYRHTGRCLMTHHTKFFLKLLLFSAVFWWFFEYLNRFVQNWYYVGCDHFTPFQYFIMATLPFSTVLPAVLSTEEWLASHPRCYAGLDRFIPLRFGHSKICAWSLLLTSVAGLLLIGVFPNQLFPLLWVAPLLLLVALQRLSNRPAFFPELRHGNWQRIFRFALAALICGFFWEMWNYHSLAKWIYSVPYVYRFKLFEMPILGYAGYLPFGLECAVIATLVKPHNPGSPDR